MNDKENESPKKFKLYIGSHDGNSRASQGSLTELDVTGSAQRVVREPNLPCPPEEAVFAIDHILESIFADLDRQTLLNCRQVSSRWGSCASQQLRNTLTIRFGDRPKDEPNKYYLLKVRSERSLEDFTDLMNNSANFPSTSFSFRNKYHMSASMNVCPPIIPFLNAHGPAITKLFIEENTIWSSDLWRLLSTEAPNLEQLVLKNIYDQKCQSNSFSCKQVEVLGSDLQKPSCNEAKLILKTLKVFKCQLISDVTLALLLSCAPNLVHISVPFENLHVLLKPTNRLYLVKELHVNWLDIEGTVSLKQIADHHEKDLILEKLCFEGIPYFPSDYSKAATFMCKILNASSTTLKHLTWKGITGDFAAPPMPRVKCLTMCYCNRLYHSLNCLELTFVPISVSLGQTYPNLESLFLSTVHRNDNMTHVCFTDFFRDHIPVLSVTNVTSYFCPTKKFLEQLREMFPNADLGSVDGFTERRLVYTLFPPKASI